MCLFTMLSCGPANNQASQSQPKPASQDTTSSEEYWIATQCQGNICLTSETGKKVQLTKNTEGKSSASPVWSLDAEKIYVAQTDPVDPANPPPKDISVNEWRNSDIYQISLKDGALSYFYGDPLPNSFGGKLPLNGNVQLGIERPVRATKNNLIVAKRYPVAYGHIDGGTGLFSSIVKLEYGNIIISFQDGIETGIGACNLPVSMVILDPQKTSILDDSKKTIIASLSDYVADDSHHQPGGVAVCNTDGSNTTNLDLTKDLVTASHLANNFDGSLALNADGTLYQLNKQTVATIEKLTQKTILEFTQLGTDVFFLSPDHDKLSFISDNQDLYIIDTSTGSQSKTADVSEIKSWSADGNRILALDSQEQLISIDTSNNKVVIFSINPNEIGAAQISPLPIEKLPATM